MGEEEEKQRKEQLANPNSNSISREQFLSWKRQKMLMPGKAGRVCLPANNRVHSCASAFRSAILYAPNKENAEPEGENPYTRLRIFSFFKLGGESRVACWRCCSFGHLPSQCSRNPLSVKKDDKRSEEDEESETSSDSDIEYGNGNGNGRKKSSSKRRSSSRKRDGRKRGRSKKRIRSKKRDSSDSESDQDEEAKRKRKTDKKRRKRDESSSTEEEVERRQLHKRKRSKEKRRRRRSHRYSDSGVSDSDDSRIGRGAKRTEKRGKKRHHHHQVD